MSFSNGTLVIGAELIYPSIYADDRLLQFFIGPIEDPDTLLKYPGRVCIYRLSPGKGYVLEDVIGRESDKLGRLYFKSVLTVERRPQ
ncbi:MAG: hypothetical protein LBJ86_00185 [Spirochaetaceae bacterium]|nr:hypothetical protein [Spirochaetaceae bacterium]